jgi:hypothetical protein
MNDSRKNDPSQPGVIFEFTQIGQIVKVTAMDTATLTEVVIQGPASAGQATLQRTALAKLQHVLKGKKAEK